MGKAGKAPHGWGLGFRSFASQARTKPALWFRIYDVGIELFPAYDFTRTNTHCMVDRIGAYRVSTSEYTGGRGYKD